MGEPFDTCECILGAILIIALMIIVYLAIRPCRERYEDSESIENFDPVKDVKKAAGNTYNEYASTITRGSGFPWKFGDKLNDSGMFKRCEAKHGEGNCEKYGAIAYPKCTKIASDKNLKDSHKFVANGCCLCIRKI